MTLKRFLIGVLVVWLLASAYIAATDEPVSTPEPEPPAKSAEQAPAPEPTTEETPAPNTEVIVFKTKTAGGATNAGTIFGGVNGTVDIPVTDADETYKIRAERGATVNGYFVRGNSTGTLRVKIYQDGLLIGDLKANEQDPTANFGWTVKRAEDYV